METLGELSHTLSLAVNDPSHIAEARRQVSSLVHYGDFSESDNGRLALIITELATNILKHAGSGSILVQSVTATKDYIASDGLIESEAALLGLDLIAIDQGPGMHDPRMCLQDGYSTAGSQGSGLGAISRQSDAFHIYTIPGKGSVQHARLIGERSISRAEKLSHQTLLSIAGINVPYKGEAVSGDSWGCKIVDKRLSIILADGIGHGHDAHVASRTAIEVFHESESDTPAQYLSDLHSALSATRGAATSIATWDVANGELTFCGIGNVSGSISQDEAHPSGSHANRGGKKMMTFNGTLGHNVGKYRDLRYPLNRDGVVIMHSDGLSANWSLDSYPGLAEMPPIVIAAVLYRDHSRDRDDSSIAVAKVATHDVRFAGALSST